MTAFYKIVDDDVIIGFGTNGSDEVTAITESEYAALLSMFNEKPTAAGGYDFLLRDDPREWVLVEAPIGDEDVDDAEAFEMLFGGAV